jgi:hypothetical protein
VTSRRQASRAAAAPHARPAGRATGGAIALPRVLDPGSPYLLPLLALLLGRILMMLRTPSASEDAYITFRYAWNWAHGLGPVFNAGERVLGYTSAPWMAWIALGIKFGIDPIPWTRVTLLAADVVTLLALVSLIERHVSRAAAWCFAYFFAVWIYFAGVMPSGLETGAMVGLIALTAWLLDRGHPASGAALGLLAVFRPEGLLAALVMSVWAKNRDRLLAAVVVAVVAVILAAYYGSPVPQSVIAKANVYGTPGPLAAPQWWEWLVPIASQPNTSEAKLLACFYILFTPCAVAGITTMWSERRTALAAALLAYLAIWFALFIVGASYFFWYLAAPLVGWSALACIGLPRLVRGPHLYVGIALITAANWIAGYKLYSSRARIEARDFGYVADFIQANGARGDVVFLEPIGTVGWRCHDLRLVDEVGLVSPEISTRRQAGKGWYSDFVNRQRPRWMVVRAGELVNRSSFAGVGDPFRDADDEKRSLAPYTVVAATDSISKESSLCVLERDVKPDSTATTPAH